MLSIVKALLAKLLKKEEEAVIGKITASVEAEGVKIDAGIDAVLAKYITNTTALADAKAEVAALTSAGEAAITVALEAALTAV